MPSLEVFVKAVMKSTDVPFICWNIIIFRQSSNSSCMKNPILVEPKKSPVSSGIHNVNSLEALELQSAINCVNDNDMCYDEAQRRSPSNCPSQMWYHLLTLPGLICISPALKTWVQYAFCKGKPEELIWVDNPLEEHRKHFNAICRFMQGTQVGNVMCPLFKGWVWHKNDVVRVATGDLS